MAVFAFLKYSWDVQEEQEYHNLSSLSGSSLRIPEILLSSADVALATPEILSNLKVMLTTPEIQWNWDAVKSATPAILSNSEAAISATPDILSNFVWSSVKLLKISVFNSWRKTHG